VIVGGGQGRTPYVGPTIKQFLPVDRLLSYLEAVLRVYNRHGRRDNIYKARIKILVAALGAEEFARRWRKSGPRSTPPRRPARRRAGPHPRAFAKTAFETLPAVRKRSNRQGREPAFARFVAQQRQAAQAARLRHRRGLAEGSARRRATPRPTSWTSSPIWPSATASATCG
jgi:sulfite reductase (NADPH) hemoprotein beta-component